MSIFNTNVVTPSAHWAKKGTRNKPAIKLLCYLCICDSIFLTNIRKYMPPDVAFSYADYQLGRRLPTTARPLAGIMQKHETIGFKEYVRISTSRIQVTFIVNAFYISLFQYLPDKLTFPL